MRRIHPFALHISEKMLCCKVPTNCFCSKYVANLSKIVFMRVFSFTILWQMHQKHPFSHI
ncbi:hypothetical protein HanRHA438_Chr09g0408411 [Helianthus annuus]|nr:hypothetical protein HanRHA438_Chr09g0408411 [Helianthus annuus]